MNLMNGDPVFYLRSDAVKTSLIGDSRAALFNADTGQTKNLNETGFFIWRRLDGSRPIDATAAEMADAFEGASLDEVRDDATQFCRSLVDDGFATTREAPCDAPEPTPTWPNIGDGPRQLDLSLTAKCNLHCLYCFYADEMQSRKDLPKEEWLTFFGELGGLPTQTLTLTGGEVFTRRDLWELIDAIIENRMRYSILTNGMLVTEKTLRAFEQGKRRQRLSSIQVSIDGSCAEVHDKSRGKGSFKLAIRGLRLLKEAGFPTTCRVTINRHNVDDLENITRLLLEDVGLRSFSTNDAMPMGAGCDNQADITLTPQQRLQAMRSLSTLEKQHDGRITANAGPLANWSGYQEMEKSRAQGRPTQPHRMGYLTACGCVFSRLSVLHDGSITPCTMLADLALGSVNDTEVSWVWKNHPTIQALKQRRRIPMSEVGGCETCEWNRYCNGSCPGLAHAMTGDFNQANPHDCYRRFLQEVHLDRIL